jgi:GT2 family glycosyltransferase
LSATVLPETSAIICSRNRPRLLRDCVESVLRGNELPTELIIVDDSDAMDESLSTLSADGSCEIRYYWRQATGLSSAQNFAIRKAHHDLLVFTQDDAEVEPTWFSRIVRAQLQAGPRALVTGQVRPGGSEAPMGFVSALKVQQERAVYRGRLDRDVLYALNMAMHRWAAEEIGPFDERLGPGTRFPASEDSDFAFRALEAGFSIVYEPTAAVRHRAWRGEERYAGLRWGYGFARGGFYAKYLSLRDRHMLRRLWRDLRNHLMPLPRLAVRDRRTASGHLLLSCGIVAGAMCWMLTERRAAGPGDR